MGRERKGTGGEGGGEGGRDREGVGTEWKDGVREGWRWRTS